MGTAKANRQPPVIRTPEEKAALSQAIMDGMACDGMTCYDACAAVGVPMGTFVGWTVADPELGKMYAAAREALLERLAADTLRIADAPVGSTDSGATDSGAVQKQRLQVDTRKWMLAKLAPKKWGDKLELSGDEKNPLQVGMTVKFVKPE